MLRQAQHDEQIIFLDDVWLGHDALLMPGFIVRRHFDEATVARLQAGAWWHWDAAKTTRHQQAIGGLDLTALEQAT